MTSMPAHAWLIAVGGSLTTLAGDEWMKWHFRARSETKRRFREVRENVDDVMVGVNALAVSAYACVLARERRRSDAGADDPRRGTAD